MFRSGRFDWPVRRCRGRSVPLLGSPDLTRPRASAAPGAIELLAVHERIVTAPEWIVTAPPRAACRRASASCGAGAHDDEDRDLRPVRCNGQLSLRAGEDIFSPPLKTAGSGPNAFSRECFTGPPARNSLAKSRRWCWSAIGTCMRSACPMEGLAAGGIAIAQERRRRARSRRQE